MIYKTVLSTYLSSLEPFHDLLDFQNSRNIPPPIPISQFEDLTLYTRHEMDEYPGSLLSADPDFFPSTRPTTLQAKQSSPDTPTEIVTTLYSNTNDPPTPPPNL